MSRHHGDVANAGAKSAHSGTTVRANGDDDEVFRGTRFTQEGFGPGRDEEEETPSHRTQQLVSTTGTNLRSHSITTFNHYDRRTSDRQRILLFLCGNS
eukprot:COSAG01_NODE_925_length_12707_cov_21.250297_6_plen_98_part_00